MRSTFQSHQFSDADGCPAGGHTFGNGFAIAWQNGSLGRGETRQEPNGAFVEDIIAAAEARLQFYQRSRFACQENADAIDHLRTALTILGGRTARREAQGIEGTHQGK